MIYRYEKRVTVQCLGSGRFVAIDKLSKYLQEAEQIRVIRVQEGKILLGVYVKEEKYHNKVTIAGSLTKNRCGANRIIAEQQTEWSWLTVDREG